MNNLQLEEMGARIAGLMESLGYKDPFIAKELDISKVSVGKWRKGEAEPSGSNLYKLSKLLNTTPEFIVTGEHFKTMKVEGWDDDTPLEEDEFEVPFYNKVLVSAGCKEGEVQEMTEKKIKLSKSTARKMNASMSHSFSYINDGDSMEERISNGARCTADSSKRDIKDGQIYCFRHGVMRRTKYLHRRPDGGLLIRSHNKEYEDEIVAPEDMHEIEILGWVWEWSSLAEPWH